MPGTHSLVEIYTITNLVLNRIPTAIDDGVAWAEVSKRHNDTSTTPVFIGGSVNLITWTWGAAVEAVKVAAALLLMLLLFTTNFNGMSGA